MTQTHHRRLEMIKATSARRKGHLIFVLLLILLLLFFSSSSSSFYPSSTSASSSPSSFQEIDQEIDNICSALDALRNLSPRRPVSFQDPFSFLGLNPHAKPFSPPESSAHPGAVNHEAARETVIRAVSRMRRSVWPLHSGGDAGATEVMEVTFHIGHALEDDATRTRYLVDLQPMFDKMAKLPDGKWRAASEFCGNFWQKMGWW